MNIIANNDLWQQPIEIMPLIQAFPDIGELADLSQNGELPEIKTFAEKKLVLSDDHKRLFGVFSKKAVVVPHTQAVEMLDSAYRELYGEEPEIELVSMKEGAQMRAKVRVYQEPVIDIGNGDTSKMELLMFNSYDGNMKFKMRSGLFRQVCSNGMVVGDTIAHLDAHQLIDGWNEKNLIQRIRKMMEDTRKVAEVWREWTGVNISYEEAELALQNKFPRKMLEPVLDPEQYPMSVYELYQIMTRKSTHESRTERAQVSFDNMIASIFYGSRSPIHHLVHDSLLIADNEIEDEEVETDEVVH